jgi:VPS inhibitor protein A
MDSSTPTHIQIALEGNSSERMMRDLKSALESTQKAQEFSRKAYLSEVELLKKQLEELTRENTQLSTENRLLKEQVRNDEKFRSLQPQIETAQHQLTSFANLLSNLYEMTGGRSTLSSPSLMTVSSLEKENREIPFPDKIATSVSSSTTEERLSTTDSPTPPPKFKPVLHVPFSPNTHATPEKDIPSTPLVTSEQGEISVLKSTTPPKAPSKVSTSQQQEQKPTLSGEGFFNELSKELAKRKANKEPSSSTAPIQKKNM